MGQVIPEPLKEVWDRWNIRVMVLMSLTLQTILIFFAPLRRRSARKRLAALLWMSYLLADWIANYATAQITKNQGKEPKPKDLPKDKKLMALWAPFLLLHLGGPDTITALAIEDNALWQRHLFGLVSQLLSGVYAVVQSMPNVLWPPILLLFITGTIKYLERTRALYAGSLDKFRDSMLQPPDSGPNFAKLIEELSAKKNSKLPTSIVVIDQPDKRQKPLVKPDRLLTHLEIVQYAYKFFNTFKGLIVNLIFSYRERDESRDFFFKLTPEEALRIMEVELGLMYDALYTKAKILHTTEGTVSRVIALGTLVSAFCVFHYRPKKSKEFHGVDISITYTLFLVGIALDLASILMFVLSDWTFAKVSKLKDDPEEHSVIDPLLKWFLSFRGLRWKKHSCFNKDDFVVEDEVLSTPSLFRRWSGKIYGFNFIAYCLKTDVEGIHSDRSAFGAFLWRNIVVLFDCAIRGIKRIAGWIKALHRSIKHFITHWSKNPVVLYTLYPFYVGFLSRIPHFFGRLFSYIDQLFDVKDLLDKIRFISSEPLTKNLWEFIFLELKIKSEFADSEDSKKISSARGEWVLRQMRPQMKDDDKLMQYVELKSYDQSLLLWHIATELCYQEDKPTKENCEDREFSKIISDYMMYLLIMQPKLMSQVAGIGKIRFRDTKEEADKFFKSRHIEDSRDVELACEKILSVSTDIEPVEIKGDRSQSVLFEAAVLVKELQRLEEGGDGEERNSTLKWKIMSKVWVELLSFAASHIEAKEHVKQLSRGGELINFVWLLMAHLGLGDQFQINKGDVRAKLVVET